MLKASNRTIKAKGLLVGLLAALSLVPAMPASAETSLEASAARMESRIETLSQFGQNADGGVDRVAYSEADLAGRAYIIDEMKKLGLVVFSDEEGGMPGSLGMAGKSYGELFNTESHSGFTIAEGLARLCLSQLEILECTH